MTFKTKPEELKTIYDNILEFCSSDEQKAFLREIRKYIKEEYPEIKEFGETRHLWYGNSSNDRLVEIVFKKDKGDDKWKHPKIILRLPEILTKPKFIDGKPTRLGEYNKRYSIGINDMGNIEEIESVSRRNVIMYQIGTMKEETREKIKIDDLFEIILEEKGFEKNNDFLTQIKRLIDRASNPKKLPKN